LAVCYRASGLPPRLWSMPNSWYGPARIHRQT